MATVVVEPLENRLLKATVGSCSCGTKTPKLECHDQMCHFRLFEEAHIVISAQRKTNIRR